MSRLQLKFMGALTALVVAVVLTTSLLAEQGLRSREQSRLERSLEARGRLVQSLVAGIPFEIASAPALDRHADEAGSEAGARITLVAADGSVVGDSEVPLAGLGDVENHAGRPEVVEALAGRIGKSQRYSDTVKRPFLYLALPPRPGGPGGIVRLAVELDDVDAAAAELRRELLTAGAIGLLAALGLSFAISYYTLRPVEELRDVVGRIADGQLERRLGWVGGDELGEIATSINRVAEQLRQRLDEATAEKNQLEAVLRSMVEGVLVLDARGQVAMANPRLRELLSVWGEIEGRKPIEVIRNATIDGALREAHESDQPVAREIELDGPSPRTLRMYALAFPSTGPREGIIAVFRDVTEIRRLDQVRRDFISNASHELRTPLTSIRGFADTLLASELSPEDLRSYLQAIVRNSERLGHLIDDLLELSRIESRKVALRPAAVNVDELCRTLLGDLEPRLRDAQLEAILDPGIEASIAWADRRAIEQIVSNLLDNAIQYSDAGGRITVRVTPEESLVRICVEDTGIGIAEADRGRIFERFYRVDAARSRALGGTGLGLAIVKHLVQAMGGEIQVESEPGRGSRFQFSLPRV